MAETGADDGHGRLFVAEGWVEERPALRPEELDELIGLVQSRVPATSAELLVRHLPLIFAEAVGLQSIGKPKGKKPATHIRDEIEALVRDLAAAQERLASLDPLMLRYLEAEVTNHNAGVLVEENSPSLDQLREELLDRIGVLVAIGERVKPITRRAGETGWGVTARALVRLIGAATGSHLGRSYDAAKGVDTSWHLQVFKRFVAMVNERVSEELQTRSWGSAPFASVWRRACEEVRDR